MICTSLHLFLLMMLVIMLMMMTMMKTMMMRTTIDDQHIGERGVRGLKDNASLNDGCETFTV